MTYWTLDIVLTDGVHLYPATLVEVEGAELPLTSHELADRLQTLLTWVRAWIDVIEPTRILFRAGSSQERLYPLRLAMPHPERLLPPLEGLTFSIYMAIARELKAGERTSLPGVLVAANIDLRTFAPCFQDSCGSTAIWAGSFQPHDTERAFPAVLIRALDPMTGEYLLRLLPLEDRPA